MGTADNSQDARQLLEYVEQQWHRDFLEFIHSGDARPEFLAYIDTNASCQRAIEMAFDMQVAAFDRLASAMQQAEAASTASVAAESPSEPRAETAAVFSVLTTLRNVGVLPYGERRSVLQKAVADFTASAQPSESRAVAEVTAALGEEIGRAVASGSEADQGRPG
jgi:hypothetical protein